MFEERQKIKKSLEHRKTQKEKEEKEMNEVIDIYQKAKHRIDCMKKTREKEVSRLNSLCYKVMACNIHITFGQDKYLDKINWTKTKRFLRIK